MRRNDAAAASFDLPAPGSSSAQALDHRVAADAALRHGETLAAVERHGEVAALDAEAQSPVAVGARLLG